MQKKKAVFVGLTTLDIVYGVHGYPIENLKHTASEMAMSSGGSAANAAVACAGMYPGLAGKTGLPSLARETPSFLVTRAGKSGMSLSALSDLAGYGVRVIPSELAGEMTLSSIIVNLDNGSRTIVSRQGRYDEKQPHVRFVPSLLDGAGMVLTDCYEWELAQLVLSEARRRAIPVVADIGRYHGEESDRFLELCDIAIVSEVFADGDFDDAVAMLAKLGVDVVAMTHGGDDIEFSWHGSRGRVPVERVRAVDTLGAGDFLHGAFVKYAVSEGIASEMDFVRALRAGAAVATASTQVFGSRTWLDEFGKRRS